MKHTLALLLTFSAMASAAAFTAGCDEPFDPKSKLDTLRILGVQADHPYPRPGQNVHLKMLWHDGKAPLDQPRPVQILWISGCVNPEGDMYYGCFPQLADKLSTMKQGPQAAQQYLGLGDEFTLKIPDDIISSRPPPPSGEPYGLTYVFFAACAGRIGPVEPSQTNGAIPIGCFSQNDEPLGPDDFVVGYMGLYSYEKRQNTNPSILALTLNDQTFSDDSPIHIPHCEGDCHQLPLEAVVDPASVEWNEGYEGPEGQPLHETMWVEYSATDGTIKHGTKLVSDALRGFVEDDATGFEPPAEPGELEIYAVVRDNRGGTSWAKGRVIVD